MRMQPGIGFLVAAAVAFPAAAQYRPDAEAVRGAFEAVRGAVETCTGGVAGTIDCAVSLTGADGAPTAIWVTSDLGDAVDACVTSVIRAGVRVPPFAGESQDVRYTYRTGAGAWTPSPSPAPPGARMTPAPAVPTPGTPWPNAPAARPAVASATPTDGEWTSDDTFSATDPWWSLQLEERFLVGDLLTDIWETRTSLLFGLGLFGTLNIDHHWNIAGGVAFDFPIALADMADAYAAVGTTLSFLDVSVIVRLGFQPLALSWLTLGAVVEAGGLIDSTSVASGGSEESVIGALFSVGGAAKVAFFPHDAFEIGLRAGYRYLVGKRPTLEQGDAERLRVPVGPYRGIGDVAVTLYQSLHF